MATATNTTTGIKETADQTVARANAMLAQTKAEGSKAFKGSSYEKALSAIPATDLTPQASPTLPPAPVPNDPGPIVESNNAALAPGLSSNGLTLDESTGKWSYTAPTQDATSQDNYGVIFDAYLKQLSAPPSTLDAYNQERDRLGVDEKQRTYSNLSAKLNSITANRDAQILRQEGINEKRDVTQGIYSAQTSRIMRDAAIEALPVQAQLAAAQGDLQMAQETLNTMYQIKSQDAQAEWQFKQNVASSLFAFMNASEQRRLDKVMKDEERTYQDRQSFLETQKALLSSAIAQGAPRSIVDAISGAKTSEDAVIAAAEYNGDVLARQIQQQQLYDMRNPKANDPASIMGVTVGKLMSEPGFFDSLGADGDQLPDALIATAGGRALTQGEQEPLTNASRVMGQLENISEGFFTTTNGETVSLADQTGPLWGIIRSNNPYDVKAAEMKAQLIAIVPQLARGVYGEVGVLTDSDVERYVQTLPNLTSPQDLNKALTALTLRNVRSAYVQQLMSLAAGGRDVSGFVGLYNNMTNTINTIESQLGINESFDKSLDGEYDTQFGSADASAGGTQVSLDNIGNVSWSKTKTFLKGLFLGE
jgi:hypothetical protein